MGEIIRTNNLNTFDGNGYWDLLCVKVGQHTRENTRKFQCSMQTLTTIAIRCTIHPVLRQTAWKSESVVVHTGYPVTAKTVKNGFEHIVTKRSCFHMCRCYVLDMCIRFANTVALQFYTYMYIVGWLSQAPAVIHESQLAHFDGRRNTLTDRMPDMKSRKKSPCSCASK